MKKTKCESSNKIKNRRKRIINRLIFDVCMFLFLLVIGTLLLNKSLQFENEKVIKYNEKSNLDYKVYLQKNTDFAKPYYSKSDDVSFLTSLIIHFSLPFLW